MGGTTAKAGLVENGEVLRSEALEVGAGVMAGSRLLVGAGYLLKLPAIDLAEVGAGGGSICRLDAGGAPKVGPDSAGADPGPVCYGRGGTEPTITDCNLVLGYLDPAGLVGGALKLDVDAARAAIARALAEPLHRSVEEAAHGMLRLASASMMRAIRAVSVERGRDPRQFALLAFGGNGPLFAAAIAAELGITRVIVPPLPGVFSAFGLLVADAEHHATRSLRMRSMRPMRRGSRPCWTSSAAAGAERLARDGFPPERQQFRRAAQARYVGQSSEIEVRLPDAAISCRDFAELFGEEHERNYGFRAPPDEPVELMGLSVIARGMPDRPRLPDAIPPASMPGSSQPTRLVSGRRLGRHAGGRPRATDRAAARRSADRAGIRRDMPRAALRRCRARWIRQHPADASVVVRHTCQVSLCSRMLTHLIRRPHQWPAQGRP